MSFTTILRSIIVKSELSFGHKNFRRVLALATIVAVIVTAYYQYTPRSYSATSYWTQTDWSGGATANMKTHPDQPPPNDWKQYASIPAKDASINVANGGADLQMTYQNLHQFSDSRKNITDSWGGYSITNYTSAVDTSTGIEHVVYASTEYNKKINLVYRNSSNWNNPTYITTSASDIYVNFNSAKLYIGSDHTVHLLYSSTEYNGNVNIAYRNSSNWSTRTDVTQQSAQNLYTFDSAIAPNNVIHVAYFSQESQPGYWNLVYRSSSNWASPTYVTTYTANKSFSGPLRAPYPQAERKHRPDHH